MNKFGMVTLGVAATAMFLAIGTGAAKAASYSAPSFDFSSTSLDPAVSIAPDGVFTFTDIAGTVSGGTLAGAATLSGSGDSSDFTLTLDEGANTYSTVTAPITDVVGVPGVFNFESLNGNASTDIGTIAFEPSAGGGGLDATYISAPVPEVSSSIALAAMLALGGILLLASKRKSASAIA